MKNKGFSLLELLVVISIVSVLLAIAASSYSTTQKKARDARRMSDIKTIQQAAEQYYSVCGYTYPDFSNTGGGANDAIICQTNPTRIILPSPQLPLDPKSLSAYPCSGTCNSSGFTLCATAELGGTLCVSNQQ